MDYLVVLSLQNYSAIMETLKNSLLIPHYDLQKDMQIALDIASGVKVELRRTTEECGICTVALESEKLDSGLVLDEVLLLLNNNGIRVSSEDILLYRKG